MYHDREREEHKIQQEDKRLMLEVNKLEFARPKVEEKVER